MLDKRGRLLSGRFSFVSGWATVALCSIGLVRADDLSKAENLYKQTDFDASLSLLDKHSSNAATEFLIGRDFFMLGDFKKSTDYLLKAVALQTSSAEYFDWLGRSYGKRAETSNPLMAPGFASRARQAFERALELDPKNNDALSDVFDYYLEAPGFLGGGYDKAFAIAQRTAAIDPPEGYFEQAKLAQKRKEYQTAEDHFRRAVAAAPHEVGHLVALARFLATQGRNGESDAVFLEAQKVNPNAPGVWFARADVLIKQRRNLDEAKVLLEKYVQAPITVDDPPKQDARRLLKQVGGA
jgi:tetratricopeptide (TPR) repeat protein